MDFIIDDDQTQSSMAEREIVPAGVHAMFVKHAEEGPNQYKECDENPEGQCLKLRLATVEGNYKFVFDDIPKHLGWRAKQLADAIGLSSSAAKLSLEPSDLNGLELTVEVSHYTSKAGKVSAVVKRYVPKPAAVAAYVPKARAPLAKVVSSGPDNDIPF